MHSENREQESSFSLWLMASLLFHVVLIILLLFWYFEAHILEHLLGKRFFDQKKEKQQLQVAVDQKTLLPQQEKKQEPILWKDIKKPDIAPEKSYTLIPGRQAVTEATQDKDPALQKSDHEGDVAVKPSNALAEALQKAKNQEAEKAETKKSEHQEEQKREIQKRVDEEKPKIDIKEELQIKKKDHESKASKVKEQKRVAEIEQQKREAIERSLKRFESKIVDPLDDPLTPEERYELMRAKLVQERKLNAPKPDYDEAAWNTHQESMQPSTSSAISQKAKQLPYAADPTIVKKNITLKDLKLGFSKFMQEGNNDILLHQGNTNETPDAAALRKITYQQQMARTMRDALLTHESFHKISQYRGLQVTFTTTTDRIGKLIHSNMIIPSGNALFDQIVRESLYLITLFPEMPKHIPGDTFTQTWTYLH